MILAPRDIEDLIEVVRGAGSEIIMPAFRNLAENDVKTKSGPMDLVTEADRAAEEAIRNGAKAILPNVTVVGEEAVADNSQLLAAIKSSETCIVVDPIDGTGNYVAGLAVFGTILSVIHYGQTLFGLLYDPVLDDWMFAIRGDGAWYRRRDGTCTRARSRDDGRSLAQASGFVAFEDYDSEAREVLRRAFDAAFQVRDIRCSCHEYRLLASGNADFLRSYSLKPWDHAAGLLLLAEAGGWAAIDGVHPYSPTITDGRIVAAGSEALGREIARMAGSLP